MKVGAVVAVIGLGFLLVLYFRVGADRDTDTVAKAMQSLPNFGNMALLGSVAVCLGAAWLLWGEETLGPLALVLAGALYFSPQYLPYISGYLDPTAAGATALGHVQNAGIPFAVMGVGVIVADLILRARMRALQGARAEQIKYGKGLKEETDIKDVFMGKCWQLPYCRKFVRERCPIYHARRTCWKERVGCMCEETVIRNAMEGKPVSESSGDAYQLIPRNSLLTPYQKAERCRQCVIYNEHQKHKYRLLLGVAIGSVAVLYALLRAPLAESLKVFLIDADRNVRGTIFVSQVEPGKITSLEGGSIPFHEIMLFALTFVVLAYVVRFLEFLIFKLKV